MAVLDISPDPDSFDPVAMAYKPSDDGQRKKRAFSFEPKDSSPCVMVDANTVAYGYGNELRLDTLPESGQQSPAVKFFEFDSGTILAIESDGLTISAVSSLDEAVKLTVSDRTVTARISLGVALTSADIADGLIYASLSGGGLGSWDMDGRRLGEWASQETVEGIAKRGSHVSATRADKVVVVDLVTNETAVFDFDSKHKVRLARADSRGNQLVVLFESQEFAVFDLAAKKEYPKPILRLPLHAEKPVAFDISDDGMELVIATGLFMPEGLYTCYALRYSLSEDPNARSFFGPGLFGSKESWSYMGSDPRSIVLDARTGHAIMIGSPGIGPARFLIRGDVFAMETLQTATE